MTDPFENPEQAILELQKSAYREFSNETTYAKRGIMTQVTHMKVGDAMNGNWVVGNTRIVRTYVDMGHDLVAVDPRELAEEEITGLARVLQRVIEQKRLE